MRRMAKRLTSSLSGMDMGRRPRGTTSFLNSFLEHSSAKDPRELTLQHVIWLAELAIHKVPTDSLEGRELEQLIFDAKDLLRQFTLRRQRR